ncbi:hypothetical protein ID866_2960 [Astraeus odoratus]|nr:hypothetical protein ID866_2960 [Astraeus odoratus]
MYYQAHHTHLQKCFDTKEIRFGVQWQIARQVTLGHMTYEDIVVPELDKLKGPNRIAAPLVERLFCPRDREADGATGAFFDREKAATLPWSELDREHESALMEDCFHRQPDGWYGGKVHFTASLKSHEGGSMGANYGIILNRPELGSSTRLSRQFGSYAILRIRIPRQLMNKGQSKLVEFFYQRFLLCGVYYRAFYAKDSSVFLIATNECDYGVRLPRHALPRPLSFTDFLNWHNPIVFNKPQTMSKWASRFALGLSNSVPGITLDPANIFLVDDIVVGDSVMTDGCGFINIAALKKLCAVLDWDPQSRPTAIQCRIAGAKVGCESSDGQRSLTYFQGLLIIHPDPSTSMSDIPGVWLRPSQIKIHYHSGFTLPKGQVTIDVLRSSHIRYPSSLAAEILVNLAENGVPHDIFIDLMKENVDGMIDKFLGWEGPDAMFRLWYNVAAAGGVVAARKAREMGGEARMRGFSEKDEEDEDEDDLDNFQDSPQSTAWWADEISGCPSSMAETILVLLDAGFTPQECPFLAEKLKNFIRSSVKAFLKHPKLEVPMSCSAWIVPDPSGTLAPDEVQILAKDAKFSLPGDTLSHFVLGDVLLARYPCKLPTDIQKVKAVVKPELQNYTDVIVCSIQGSRRFAELLAGGDYDGDKAIAIWQPAIVTPFKNAPLHYSHPPKDLMDNFKKDESMVSHLLEIQGCPSPSLESKMQVFLLGGLQDSSLVGRYSNFHDISIYTLGYNHPETIRLAHMFCHVLDSTKSGLAVLPEVLQKDIRKFHGRAPQWKETEDDTVHEGNELNPTRDPSLPSFVMDMVTAAARQHSDMKLSRMQQAFPHSISPDSALLKPWNDAKERAEKIRVLDPGNAGRMDLELSRIQSHVKEVLAEFKAKVGKKFTGFKIERRQDILRDLAHHFAKNPDPSCLFFSQDELAQFKASYAYKLDPEGKFAFSVAMRDLGHIKARSLGPTKTVQLVFYDRFAIKKSFLR